MDPKELTKKTVLVLGTGKTGLSAASFLIDKTKNVLLSESKKRSKDNEELIKNLEKKGVKTEFGKNSDDFLSQADLIIISPGINPFLDIVKKATSLNIPIISDIELGSYFITKPIIAVTGTNGKTTTTSLITHIINNSGKKAIACGNIGRPITETALNKDIDFYVLEVSSFQLFYSPTLSVKYAVCLNITPDHLEWHKDFEHYLNAKKKLFLQQAKNSWAFLNLADDNLRKFNLNNNVFYFSTYKVDTSKHENIAFFENDWLQVKYKNNIIKITNKNTLKIIGTHNIENSLAATAVLFTIGIHPENIKSSLESFQGTEHRLEYVCNTKNKLFYNDSKATNPESTIKAIEALNQEKKGKKITLILGGRDKNTDLKPMISAIKQYVARIILFGEAKDRFNKELIENKYVNEIKIVNNLEEAVNETLSSNTDIVLFSPACSSFDMFKNYEERGKKFKEIIRSI